MSDMVQIPPRDNWERARIGVMIVCALATLVWLSSFIPGIKSMQLEPARQDGFAWIPAFFSTALYVPTIIPAFLLALFRNRVVIGFAAAFAAIWLGVACSHYFPIFWWWPPSH